MDTRASGTLKKSKAQKFQTYNLEIVYQSLRCFPYQNRGAAEWQIAVARMLALSEFYSESLQKKYTRLTI